MKKVLVVLLIVSLLFTLCACSVPHNSFMSKSMVNSLVKAYPNPQAKVTFTYDTGGNNFEVTITYNLLLDKAPLAVTRFIQIANEGGYDGTLVDALSKSAPMYAVMGRYTHQNEYYAVRTTDVTFAGEFASNGYREPKGGYAEFKLYSLAMFHKNEGEYFDSADGTFILALAGAGKTLSSANYAVFAEFASMTVKTNGETTTKETTSPSAKLRDHLLSFSTTSRTIYDSVDKDAPSFSAPICSTEVKLTVEIVEGYDWSKLPTIR